MSSFRIHCMSLVQIKLATYVCVPVSMRLRKAWPRAENTVQIIMQVYNKLEMACVLNSRCWRRKLLMRDVHKKLGVVRVFNRRLR